MFEYKTLKGELKIGQYKTIYCTVQLEIATFEDNAWDEPDADPTQYIDGVRIIGELSFDTSPIQDKHDHPIQPSLMAELTLHDDEQTSKLNVLIVEQSAIVDIIPRQIKRYFWKFFAVGKPAWDKIGLFPANYRGKKGMNRIYSCTDFRGYWPVSVSSIIVAIDKKEAKRLLDAKLRECGIPIEGDGDYTLTEIDIQTKGAIILNNGEYM